MTPLVRVIAALGLVVAAWMFGRSRSRKEIVRERMVWLVLNHPWLTVGMIGVGAIAIGAATMISGVVPIRASSGHWAITAALLDFAKTRSVATYSLGIKAPALDDEFLIVRGAGHYETACVPCHGGPGRRPSRVMTAMTPTPPELTGRIARWAPEELFSIVKHGIKFTGMPAWPAQQRDDEVWAMVAFLRRLPALDASTYDRLAFSESSNPDRAALPVTGGDSPPPAGVRTVCWRCHGVDGTGGGEGAFPGLAGQRSGYLTASLHAFRDRQRFSAIMGEVATKLSDAAMQEIANYYERLPSRVPEVSGGDEAVIARGRLIATRGIPERDIPACSECHGPTAIPKNPAYPKLAGQPVRYLVAQLSLLQEGRRGGTGNVNLMQVFVNRLRHDEISDVARYYAAIPAQ